jgi:hypothetical protein
MRFRGPPALNDSEESLFDRRKRAGCSSIANTPFLAETARLWYYYNQLFEVKTLLTFSTG